MRFDDRLLQGYDIGQQVKKLHGHTRLDLLRDNKVVKRIEKDNTITPWIANAVGAGNFQYLISDTNILPIEQWFKGCVLTDRENNASLQMIAGDANITAQAGNDAYSGTNQKRGSYNSTESGLITGGKRFVWDWTTNQGNGVIASVCLTREALAKAMLVSSGNTAPDESAIEFLGTRYAQTDQIWLSTITIVDYENEVGYKLRYSSGTITIVEYDMNTKRLHLLGNYMSYINSTTHTITQTVTGNICSVSLMGGVIHVISVSGSTLYDYAIDISTWTCTETSHTYSGVTYATREGTFIVDRYPIIDGYIYIFGTQKIYKCSLSNDADITEFDNPLYTCLGITYERNYNGPSLLLPNGDWYKFPYWTSQTYGIYCHNGAFYVVKMSFWYGGHYNASIAGNNYGTQVLCNTYTDTTYDRNGVGVLTVLPYVSTVNNLETAVTKSADLTMKLTYEITEV